eukprot:561865-Rhodomonas_salina.1
MKTYHPDYSVRVSFFTLGSPGHTFQLQNDFKNTIFGCQSCSLQWSRGSVPTFNSGVVPGDETVSQTVVGLDVKSVILLGTAVHRKGCCAWVFGESCKKHRISTNPQHPRKGLYLWSSSSNFVQWAVTTDLGRSHPACPPHLRGEKDPPPLHALLPRALDSKHWAAACLAPCGAVQRGPASPFPPLPLPPSLPPFLLLFPPSLSLARSLSLAPRLEGGEELLLLRPHLACSHVRTCTPLPLSAPLKHAVHSQPAYCPRCGALPPCPQCFTFIPGPVHSSLLTHSILNRHPLPPTPNPSASSSAFPRPSQQHSMVRERKAREQGTRWAGTVVVVVVVKHAGVVLAAGVDSDGRRHRAVQQTLPVEALEPATAHAVLSARHASTFPLGSARRIVCG